MTQTKPIVKHPRWRIKNICKYNSETRQVETLPFSEGFMVERLLGDDKTYFAVIKYSADGKRIEYVCSRRWAINEPNDWKEIHAIVKDFVSRRKNSEKVLDKADKKV